MERGHALKRLRLIDRKMKIEGGENEKVERRDALERRDGRADRQTDGGREMKREKRKGWMH